MAAVTLVMEATAMEVAATALAAMKVTAGEALCPTVVGTEAAAMTLATLAATGPAAAMLVAAAAVARAVELHQHPAFWDSL